MSTGWYLECADHDPPLLSHDVAQHDRRLYRARELWRNRDLIVGNPYIESFADYFDNNILRFMRQHPKCSVRLRSEYGETQPIEGDDEPTAG